MKQRKIKIPADIKKKSSSCDFFCENFLFFQIVSVPIFMFNEEKYQLLRIKKFIGQFISEIPICLAA